MRRWLLLCAAVLLLGGCGGAAKQQFQAQSVRLQEVEARVAEVEGQLETEREGAAAAAAELEACRVAARTVDEALRESRVAVKDLEQRLRESGRREDSVRADLDLSRRSLSADEENLARMQKEHARQQEAWAARETELLGVVETARSENATLQAEVHVLLEEKNRVEREKREKLEEISQTYDGLLESMREQVEQGKITISNLRGQLSVKLQDEILFDSGSATVKPAGKQLLTEIAAALQQVSDRGILVEGHTDNLPIRGDLARRFPTNWELSAARALSVVRYLQAEGVDPERLAAAARGEYLPAAPNDSNENRARNRRIELKLVPLETHAGAAQPAPPAPANDEAGQQGQ